MTRDHATPGAEPHGEYTERLTAASEDVRYWGGRERWLSHARLVVFLAGLGVGWLAFGTKGIDAWWILPPILLFVVLLVLHDRTIQRRRRADRTAAFFESGLARLEDRWAGTGQQGEAFLDEHHPYAADFDLYGPGSLFELLCSARTPAGAQMLARWLETQEPADVVRDRQLAVDELRPRLDLRLDLSLLGEDLQSRLDPEALVEWGARPSQFVSQASRVAALAFSATSVAALALWIFTEIGVIPFLIALGLQSAFASRMRARVAPVIAHVTAPTRDLALLRGVMERLERESFESPRLAALRASLETGNGLPSRRIAQLQRLVDLLDARRNQLFAPFGALMLWGTQIAFAIERWRAHSGPALGPWLSAAAEMEALCALAGYAYEHPTHPFPEIVDDGPVFEARALGHPLLPRTGCVCNDISLGREPQAYIMSGSNMSGKSTMLRTIGCNAVLALAGAPVRAESLRISPLSIAASIRVSDSLQTGTSHFYAEIKRLRQIVDLTDGERPLLFLLDEILHGTNSHDRRIGATAIVRGLIERGAAGIVTTHDLALAKIADDLAPQMKNVHFEDHLDDEGRMAFDYRLQSGVVTRSNAIALMRSIGLDV